MTRQEAIDLIHGSAGDWFTITDEMIDFFLPFPSLTEQIRSGSNVTPEERDALNSLAVTGQLAGVGAPPKGYTQATGQFIAEKEQLRVIAESYQPGDVIPGGELSGGAIAQLEGFWPEAQIVYPVPGGIGPPIPKSILGGEPMVEPLTAWQQAAQSGVLTTTEPKPGDPPGQTGVTSTGGVITGLGGLATVATATGIVALAAGTYAVLKAVGMKMPWETASGEGMIAPWTPKLQDENGLWVSATTRPDLFGGDLGSINGVKVVKSWKAGGWPFSMTSDGRIHTVTKNGIQRTWKPKKPLVVMSGSNMRLGNAVRVQRRLDKMWRTVAKRTKVLKLA